MSARDPRGPRVSQHFKLGRTLSELDFVDVFTIGDVPLYVDPFALRSLDTTWAKRCVQLVQSFFHEVVDEIRGGNFARARTLLGALKEPNETHLGLSKAKAQGHGLGKGPLAARVAEALSQSKAIRSGLLTDLEDTVLMIPSIGPDVVSDITTNLIRPQLIEYTQRVADFYGIPLELDVESGPLWNAEMRRWDEPILTSLPLTRTGKLLLVPKVIVRRDLNFNPSEFYTHSIIPFLRDQEISDPASNLVRLIRGDPHVFRYDIEKKYGTDKRMIADLTLRYPQLLDRYRGRKQALPRPPLQHEQIARFLRVRTKTPPWDELLERVLSVPPGHEDANAYHKALERLFSALFYPDLSIPILEAPLHGARKRVDISYTNDATTGFFGWLGRNYFAPNVFVEAKNLNGDPANPELDQLAGRLSSRRGKVGVLVCRRFEDRELFVQRCRDTSNDDRGFIIPLDDDDLRALTEARKSEGREEMFRIMKSRFDRLVM